MSPYRASCPTVGSSGVTGASSGKCDDQFLVLALSISDKEIRSILSTSNSGVKTLIIPGLGPVATRQGMLTLLPIQYKNVGADFQLNSLTGGMRIDKEYKVKYGHRWSSVHAFFIKVNIPYISFSLLFTPSQCK